MLGVSRVFESKSPISLNDTSPSVLSRTARLRSGAEGVRATKGRKTISSESSRVLGVSRESEFKKSSTSLDNS